jgi:hypothetical protein
MVRQRDEDGEAAVTVTMSRGILRALGDKTILACERRAGGRRNGRRQLWREE